MKFASLGSGSNGNATVICSGTTNILVDCGFTMRETELRLARLGLTVKDLSAIVVTHEHGDHIKGVGPLARKYKLPVHLTTGTYNQGKTGEVPLLQLIENYQAFSVGDIRVTPVAVPHDAREPAQFVFSQNEYKIGVLTDIGSITPHILEVFSGCHGLLVEANHDLQMLARGPYPASLKARVSSAWGHLNNAQTCALLQQINMTNMQHLVVGHISQKNNTLEAAKQALAALDTSSYDLYFAGQDEGFDWLSLRTTEENDTSAKKVEVECA